MKILILAPNWITRYHWGHQLFRNEIARQHDVTFYGPGYDNYIKGTSVPEIVSKYGKPDLILTQYLRFSREFTRLRKVNIPKAHIIIDYVPKTINRYDKWFKQNKIDLVFVKMHSQVKRLRKSGAVGNVAWLPFSVDTEVYRNLGKSRPIDVFFVGSGLTRPDIYPGRVPVRDLIRQMRVKSYTSRIIRWEYVKKLNKVKIGVASNSIYNFVGMRYTEIPACGAMLLADWGEDLERLGFRSKENFVLYDRMKGLKARIRQYLADPVARERIAKAGMEMVRERHNNVKRVQEFTQIIEKVLK